MWGQGSSTFYFHYQCEKTTEKPTNGPQQMTVWGLTKSISVLTTRKNSPPETFSPHQTHPLFCWLQPPSSRKSQPHINLHSLAAKKARGQRTQPRPGCHWNDPVNSEKIRLSNSVSHYEKVSDLIYSSYFIFSDEPCGQTAAMFKHGRKGDVDLNGHLLQPVSAYEYRNSGYSFCSLSPETRLSCVRHRLAPCGVFGLLNSHSMIRQNLPKCAVNGNTHLFRPVRRILGFCLFGKTVT